MEEYERLSTDELRTPLDEERGEFADKQKRLLEVKSKINRGKLSNASSVTEKTLSVFLRSCCEETEKEQSYVSAVIERVRVTADRTRSNLEKVNQHAHEILKNVESDVVELSDNLQRVTSSHALLSTVLVRKESKGRVLRKREEEALRSSTFQIDRAEKLFSKIEGLISSQIIQLDSHVVVHTGLTSESQVELFELEKETVAKESTLMTHQEEEHAIEVQFRKTEAEYDQLTTQLTNRNKAKDCADSDRIRIETELTELREETHHLFMLVSSKVKCIEENEAQTSQLSGSLVELSNVLLAGESEIHQFEQSLLDQLESTKVALDDVVRSLESEVEEVENQLSADTMRVGIMDTMFGVDIQLAPDDWRASIKLAKEIDVSNNSIGDVRSALLVELDSAKTELEKVSQISNERLNEYNMAQSRIRNLKKVTQEEEESMDFNMKMVESRITQATKELEDLTNSQCIEANNEVIIEQENAVDAINEFVTPHPVRHSSLQSLQKASVEASRGLSDDSDVESVKKSVIDLPDGIVKRNAATQQCSTVRSPDTSLVDLAGGCAANGGTSTEITELTNALGNNDGDVTMEGIPLSASIDNAVIGDNVENWIRDTQDNNSPASGTTAEMVDDRFPKNIFNETNALNATDMTMDMEDDDLNLSMLGMPPATTKTQTPPPVRDSSLKSSIFINDSDSDANASVWDDNF
ncbi:hypothetical protein PENTCL1PPCAC_2587 [Pristionchus entomophagus]|uniref:Uncharacterized protein n=1 Tax=Pristionchus entomophagus TaxID=358040 RepID=A0AAV5SAV7_9BILA|nr:hypothetical protein PENTCL1PPCAC_2587 [Pristionchus entomophagus]